MKATSMTVAAIVTCIGIFSTAHAQSQSGDTPGTSAKSGATQSKAAQKSPPSNLQKNSGQSSAATTPHAKSAGQASDMTNSGAPSGGTGGSAGQGGGSAGQAMHDKKPGTPGS